MDRFDWKQTIRINFSMMKIVGLWPTGNESYGYNIYTFYAMAAVLIFQVGHIFFQTANLYFIMDNLKAVTGTIYVVLMDISILLKTYVLMKKMKMLKELMITIDSDLFQPKNPHQRQLVQPNIRAWKAIVWTFWFFAAGFSVFGSLFPILDKTFKEHHLPFMAWYPYNTKTSPQYELTYIYQVFAIDFINISNVSISALIAALNMFVASQFDILCDDLRNLTNIAENTSTDVNRNLKNCIHYHREILKFVDYVNEFYNWLLLVELFVDGISIGLAMFQLTLVAPFSTEFYCFLSYANGISMEVFMYCWFGNEIQLKSSQLPYALFESDWTGLSPDVKKNLIIFVLRVQKSLQISAFGLFSLSLETFVKRLNWKRTIRLNILILKVIGLWPAGDQSYGRNPYTLYTIVSILLFHIGHIFFQTVNLFLLLNDLKVVTGIIFILLTDIGACLKAISLIKNMKTLKQLMTTINSDLFQPKSTHQRSLIQPNINAWKTIVLTFWIFAFGCLFLWSLFPILDKTVKDYRLPFLAWYPYNTRTSPQYELTYLYQTVAINFLAMVNVNIDGLIAALNMYVGAQFDILCDDLRNLYDVENDTSEDVSQKLKDIIHHHREILRFADDANQFYNWLLFVQFFVGGVSIGISMFQLTVVVPFSSEFYSFVSYVICMTVQVFMYCWFGNEVEIKSSKVPYAVFESDWTKLSPEIKQNLIIFVLRVQKSLQISAFGLFYLSLETFVRVIGLWPTADQHYGANLYTLYTIISILVFHIGHIFFQTVNLFLLLNDLKTVTGIIFILLTDIGATLKAISLIKNMETLKQLMITINCDLFQPKSVQQRNMIQPNIDALKAIVLTFWIFAISCLSLWSLFPILDKTVKDYRLPFLAWYPYNTRTSPQYELTYLYQTVSINILAMVNVNIDGLIAALNMYVGAQFDILCDDVRNLHDVKKDSSEDVNQKLKNTINHHRKILQFADDANQFYNSLLFVQFFVGGVSIGISMFQLTVIVPFSSEFYSLISYVISMTIQVFMYCWFGNEIEIK
ncbi:7tm 6 domain containing protein, partial [Asbolus verrucosus]